MPSDHTTLDRNFKPQTSSRPRCIRDRLLARFNECIAPVSSSFGRSNHTTETSCDSPPFYAQNPRESDEDKRGFPPDATAVPEPVERDSLGSRWQGGPS